MESKTISTQLLRATSKIGSILHQIREINSTTKLIAINAAIESSRSSQLAENFSSLSEQVRGLSTRSDESFTEIYALIEKLRLSCGKAIAVRLADVAIDVIDKIDRNLFERNCDVQAWATFNTNVQACTETSKAAAARELLHTLVETYGVYHEVLLLNASGKVIAAATNQALVGKSQSDREWFKETVRTKQVHVTDMYFSPSIQQYTISYSAPVLDESGKVIGVVSTRFNWEYIHDMMEKIKLEQNSRTRLISRDGTVLASRFKFETLRDDVLWLAAGEQSVGGRSGFSIESARNGQWRAYGFARTMGYNAYAGKEWSILIEEDIQPENPSVMVEVFDDDQREHENGIRTAYSEKINDELIHLTHQLGESIESINRINNITTTLALNAAIRADRAGDEGRAFSVLAEEIRTFSHKSDLLTEEINTTLDSLKHVVQETVSTRLADAAFDTIDKVDRNLYERTCDVQAWTVFEELIDAAGAPEVDPEASALLKELHTIYEVYHDIYLLNGKGKVVATAIRQDLIGTEQSERGWFQQALQGNMHVSEMYFSDSAGAYTMAFSAPVRNKKGEIVGVLSTRLDWKCVTDILHDTMVYQDCAVYLVNSSGKVIGSLDSTEFLKRSFHDYEAFKMASNGGNGFIEERSAETNQAHLIGYARTEGYLNYKGKGWCLLISQQKS